MHGAIAAGHSKTAEAGAKILQQVGFNALPVVIGRNWDEATKQANVVRVANGSVERDSWLQVRREAGICFASLAVFLKRIGV